MRFSLRILATCTACALATTATAQDKYEVYVGQYMAAAHIVKTCKEATLLDPPGAAHLGKTTAGLREQKILRLVYYSKSDALSKIGKATLSDRGIDPTNKSQLCRFGRSVAGKNHTIGRFLRSK